MLNLLSFAYQVLYEVYKEDAYLSVALPEVLNFLDDKDKGKVTRIVYGVIEKHQEFTYIIKQLCPKAPRPPIRIVLRIGMYLIKYSDSFPDYAAVNECVELTKTIKKEQSGFVNAILKNYIDIKDQKPSDEIERWSVETNYPVWLIHKYIAEQGKQGVKKIIYSDYKHTHLRLSSLKYSASLEARAKQLGTPTGYGYLIGSTAPFAKAIAEGQATVMALDSIKICKALCPDGAKSAILDLCAAPGGKSVYLAENNPDVKVFASDVHPHRVELIKKYAERMGVNNIIADVYDATVTIEDYIDAFEYVLVDAPCSGLGVVNSDPDILLRREDGSIYELTELQYAILSTAAKYVQVGGRLVYSTCSNLKCENQEIVERFLEYHPDFAFGSSPEVDGQKNYYNDKDGNDGFYVAILVRRS